MLAAGLSAQAGTGHGGWALQEEALPGVHELRREPSHLLCEIPRDRDFLDPNLAIRKKTGESGK